MCRSVPAMRTVPSAISRSLTPASRWSAASSFSFRARFSRGGVDRDAADRDRARAAGAVAGRDPRRVALHDADLVERQVEMLRGELRIGGGMALPVRLRAGIDGRGAVLLQAHDDVLALAPGGALDVGGEADAADLAGLAGCSEPILEAGPIGGFERLRHVRVEIARVVGAVADRRRVGHLLGRDEVPAADLRPASMPGLAAARSTRRSRR